MSSKLSPSKSPRWSTPVRWLCVLLPLWWGAGCGPQEEGVDAPSPQQTSQAPLEMPPADDACHEWTRQYTTRTTTKVDIIQVIFRDPNDFFFETGRCQKWNECVTTTTWTESLVCLGPTVAHAVLERYGEESAPVCDTGWTHSNC